MIAWYFILVIYSMYGSGVTQIGPFSDRDQCNQERSAIITQFASRKATQCRMRLIP